MANFEVPIIKISKVEDHPNADRLSLNYFNEYITISAKLEDGSHRYKEGDLVVYVPEDSIVPERMLKCGFWNEEKNKGMLAGSNGDRCKAVRLRGIISQGIMYSVKSYAGYDPEKHYVLEHEFPDMVFHEGMNVAELLEIKKYEPEIPTQMAGEVTYIGKQHTGYYDVENIKKYPHIIKENDEVVVQEKIHGSHFGMFFSPTLNNNEIWDNNSGCFSKGLGGQGLVFKNNENNKDNIFVKTFSKIYDKNLFENLFDGKQFVVLGEVFGKGVQDLHYGMNEISIRIFDVKVDGKFQSWDVVKETANKLNVETVPLLYEGPFNQNIRNLKDGQTTLNNAHIREGIVIKGREPMFDPEIGYVVLKDISDQYLLRKNGTEYQ